MDIENILAKGKLANINVTIKNNSFTISKDIFSVLENFDEFIGFRQKNNEIWIFTELEWALFIERIKEKKNIPDWKWDMNLNREVSKLNSGIYNLTYLIQRKGKKIFFQKDLVERKEYEGKKLVIRFNIGMEKLLLSAKEELLELMEVSR